MKLAEKTDSQVQMTGKNWPKRLQFLEKRGILTALLRYLLFLRKEGVIFLLDIYMLMLSPGISFLSLRMLSFSILGY